MTISSLKNPLKILHLDSDAAFAKEVIQLLSAEGIKTEVEEINSRKKLIDKLQKNSYDLIFLADNAQDSSGIDGLKAVKKLKVYTPVLIFSDILDEESIVNYINAGASDYLLKTSLNRLVPVVRRIISNTRNAKIVDYQNFFETSPDLLCTCDREGHFMGINQAWGNTFGFTDAELIDKPFIQFVHPDDQKSAAAQFQKLFEEKTKISELVCRIQTLAGDSRWLHWKMKIQDNGSINAIVRDITESKLREIQITQAHHNLQKLVELYKADIVKKTLVADQIRDSVVVTDLKGNIVSWNKGSEKVFGYSPEEAVGQHIALIYPEKDYKYIQEEATNVLLEQGEKEFELRMRRKSGEVFEARLTLEVTRDSKGKVNGMLGYAIDMGPVRSGVEKEVGETQQDHQPAGPEIAAEQEMQSSSETPEVNDISAEQPGERLGEPVMTDTVPDPVIDSHVIDSSVESAIEEAKNENTEAGDEAIDNQTESSVVQEAIIPTATGAGFSIMYLEDNLSNINLVEKILGQRQDYHLITTQEPEDCIDMAKQYMPSLILLDMNLPEADGYALLKQLQQDNTLKHIPVVAVGTDTSSETVDAAKKAGFTEYLVKPLEINGFLGVIDSLLFRSSSPQVGKVRSV
ncbi:PAS domain S-box protein [Kaarinaea lacus]